MSLASAARKEGVEAVIATSWDTDLRRAAQEMGCPVIEVGTGEVLSRRGGVLLKGSILFRLQVVANLLRQNIRVWRIINGYGGEVVWIRSSKGFAFAGLGVVLSGKPIVWDIDGEPRTTGLVAVLLRLGLAWSSRVILQYRAAADAIFGDKAAARYKKKIRGLVPGIRLEVLPRKDWDDLERAGQKRPLRIIQVGALCENKNQTWTVCALGELASGTGQFEVRFVGGTLEAAYETRVREDITAQGLDEVVRFEGWRDDVHQLMSEADLLVMPSKDEGVPNAVQEAMAIGLPVMVSDRGGMPEIVQHGQTGWILPLNDPAAWSLQIQECLKSRELCSRIGRNASEYAKAHFSVEAWGREYCELIRAAIKP
ncbi:glycosyltransferase [Arhodomonas sp. SL1]|uniref:glycosyltransferase n=1 Tax=Arhodomonas sp. SL1 TaxID=3425691 RepID=UPI003F8833B3